jgi:hypothetical protein
MGNHSWGLPFMPRRSALETPLHTASPQFPGVEFLPHKIDFSTKEAQENELAIRSSMVYSKHRWPGALCTVDGPEDYRARVWRIAEELGIRMAGPRPGPGAVTPVRR